MQTSSQQSLVPIDVLLAIPGTLTCIGSSLSNQMQLGTGWTELLEVTPGEINCLQLPAVIHPLDYPQLKCAVDCCSASEPFSEVWTRIVTTSGKIHWACWNGTRSSDGLIVAIARVGSAPTQRAEQTDAEPDVLGFRFTFDFLRKRIISIEDSVYRSLCIWPREIKHMSRDAIFRLIHPENRTDCVLALNRLVQNPNVHSTVFLARMRRPDGEYRWIRATCKVSKRSESGLPLTCEGVAEDVTDTNDRALAFGIHFEDNPNPMWVSDCDSWRFLEVNQAAIDQYGYSREEFQSMTLLDLRDPEERLRFVAYRNDPFRNGSEVWTHRTKWGDVRRVQSAISLIRYKGRVARLALIVDVTEREDAIRDLDKARKTLASVVNGAPAAIVSTDTNGVVQTWNAAAEHIFGRNANDAIGRHLSSLPARPSAKLSHIETQILAGIPISRLPVKLRTRDKRLVELEATTASLHDSDGNATGMMAIVTDVTALNESRRNLEALNAELEQRVAERTVELTAANQELEAFCFSVSHDLRGPLRSIDGFSRAVLSDKEGTLTEGSRSHLERVRRAAHRMSELIDALLSLSRLTRLEIRREWVDLSEIATSVAEDLNANDLSRQVVFWIQPDLIAYGDHRLLRLLLDNLIGNAFKFTEYRTEAVIEFGFSDGEFYVADNGVGFDMSYASRLFQPFERFHAVSEFPGNGIGLAIAQRIVTRHGGVIRAEARVDDGTTMRFSLSQGPTREVSEEMAQSELS